MFFTYHFSDLENFLRRLIFDIFPTWKIFWDTRFSVIFFRLEKFSASTDFRFYFSDLKTFSWRLIFYTNNFSELKNFPRHQTFDNTFPTGKIFFNIRFLILFFWLGKCFLTPDFYIKIFPISKIFLDTKLLTPFFQLGKFCPISDFWCYFSDLENFPRCQVFYNIFTTRKIFTMSQFFILIPKVL